MPPTDKTDADFLRGIAADYDYAHQPSPMRERLLKIADCLALSAVADTEGHRHVEVVFLDGERRKVMERTLSRAIAAAAYIRLQEGAESYRQLTADVKACSAERDTNAVQERPASARTGGFSASGDPRESFASSPGCAPSSERATNCATSLLKEAYDLAGKSMGKEWHDAATAVLSAPAAEVAELDHAAIVGRVESYFKRVRKLGGDTGECSAVGVADWLLWQEGRRYDAAVIAPNSATSSSKDEARLSWLDTLLRHCPHADLTYNDDDDMDGPQGFSLTVESCSRMELHAPTLAALIDLGMSTKPDEDGNVEATEGRGA